MDRSKTASCTVSPGPWGWRRATRTCAGSVSRPGVCPIIAVSLVAWFIAFHAVPARIILSRFAKLEQQKAILNMHRVHNALSAELDALDSKAGDWANSDDAYAFMGGSNPGFVAMKIVDESFAQLKVDLIAFVDTSHHVVFAQACNADTRQDTPFPESLLHRLAQGDLLIQHTDTESRDGGLILLPDGPLLVASRPVLSRRGEGPIRGTLLFGRYIEPDEIENLAKITHNTLDFYRVDAPGFPDDVARAARELHEPHDVLVHSLTEDVTASYTFLPDIYGNPVMLLRSRTTRDIYAEGRSTVNQFLIAMLALWVVFGAILWILMYRIVLCRLARQQTEERHRAIVESSDDAIISETLDGVITSWNRGAERIFGYSSQEAVGKTLSMLVPPEHQQEERDILRRIERGETIEHFGTTRLRKDGNRIEAAMTVSPIRDVHGSVVGVARIARDVTERSQAEHRLRASETRYRALFESSQDAILILEPPAWRFTSGNPAAVRMFGAQTEEELVTLGPSELSPKRQLPDGRLSVDKARDMIETALRESSHRFEWIHRRISGEEFPANVLLTRMEWKGEVILQATVRDISEQRQMEQTREQSLVCQEQLNALQQALLAPGTLPRKLKMITDGVVDIFDADFCRIWCLGPGDLCERGCVHAATTEGPYACRDRNKCLHLVTSSGRYTHTDGLIHRRIPFGVYKIGGVASGQDHEFLTNNVTQDPRVHDHDWARRLGLVSFAGYQVRPPGGETLGVLALFSRHAMTREEDGQLDSLSSTTARVIQAAQVEEALHQSEERYRTVAEHTYDWEFWRMPDGRLTYCSPSCERISGYRSDEYLDDPTLLRRIVHPDDLALWDQHITASSESAQTHTVDCRIVTHQGEVRWIAHVCSPVYAGDGTHLGRRGSNRDITKRKQSEEAMQRAYEELEAANARLLTMQSQVVQSEKLASIGQLAAGVAHEMNTPVGFVASNFETLEGYIRKIRDLLALYDGLARLVPSLDGPRLGALTSEIDRFRSDKRIDFILQDIRGLFDDSREGLQRVTSIIQNLRDFSRIDQPGSRDEYDLNKGIEATLIVARHEIKYDAEVRTEFSDLPVIFCHGGQINQVLLNILINAAQAIRSQTRDSKGTITVRTRASEDGVVCEIADDGPGIAPQHLHKVFDPFFTTKPPGKGTGLGLSVSHDIIVHKHGGRLLVESTVGQGTTFTIHLPIGSKENEEQENAHNEDKTRVVCGR